MGPLVVTRLVVVNFPIAWDGSVVLAWGLVPATATATINIMHVVSTFINLVTRLVRLVCVFWIMPALVVQMLRFWSMHVTGLEILVVSRCRCLAVTARILFGTTMVVPFTITCVQRNLFGIVVLPMFVVCMLSFVTTMGVVTHFGVELLFQFTAHLASGGLSNLVLSLLLKRAVSYFDVVNTLKVFRERL